MPAAAPHARAQSVPTPAIVAEASEAEPNGHNPRIHARGA
jgi:hypothetical protein